MAPREKADYHLRIPPRLDLEQVFCLEVARIGGATAESTASAEAAYGAASTTIGEHPWRQRFTEMRPCASGGGKA